METNGNNSKIVLSVRISPEAKQKLTEEAVALGTTLSEHAERILLNAKSIKSNDEKVQLLEANAKLNQEVSTLKAQTALLSAPAFLNLFEQVKGLKDEVTTSDGKKYSIVYFTPADLLWTMIHSFKLKQ